MPSTLIVRHSADNRFRVLRPDGKAAPEVALEPPESVQVAGRPDSHLLADLAWYLEQFLDYPFPPNTDLALRIQSALQDWGTQCFTRLFAGDALIWYDRARQEGLEHLTLKIASDDPRVLGWPWEALRDPYGSTLAHGCRIERQLSDLHDPLPLPAGLPQDRIHILLVIARPYGETDVGYHALARPLVEQARKQGLPVRLEVLRPPTFKTLQTHLRRHPGRYHIVHFDGHGGYGPQDPQASAHSFRGAEGRLIFEDAAGNPDPIPAAKLSALLTEHRIPVMVLNACQSARIDARADDPFASVAAALLKAGMRAVVAMGYSLYVSAAERFVPAFYERLLESGTVAEAVRAGRQAMLLEDRRVCARGDYPLQDWLVPVLYQQDTLDLPVAALRGDLADGTDAPVALPAEARLLGDLSFIGRQRAIHALERALLTQPQAALLVHGMAGIGKSTLIRGFLDWLAETHGLGRAADGAPFVGVLWLPFDDLRSLEAVINPLIEHLFGFDATAAPLEQKLPALTDALRRTPLLIVWDNFESAAGIPGTPVEPLLPETDRAALKALLHDLRGGRTRVLMTSRAPETWLDAGTLYRLPLAGLIGEERWAFCNAALADLGLKPDRNDAHLQALMDALEGHPLAMRAVLPRLAEPEAEQGAGALLASLNSADAYAAGDASTRAIFAALSLLDAGLPNDFAPVLELIGLHRRFLDIDQLEDMARRASIPVARATLEHCLAALEGGGLVQQVGQGIYRMHPALSDYLTERRPAAEPTRRGFVEFMGRYADSLTQKELHEQRGPFALHDANLHRALALASALGMDWAIAALTQALAAFAQNRRDFAAARRLFEALASHCEQRNAQDGLAGAYHQLGMIAEEQRDFPSAEAWYRKSLAITEQQGNAHGAALTYHQLGIIAQEQRDFAGAETWYRKSLAIKEQQGDAHGVASTYHQLGIIAQAQRNFAGAEAWYRKSLAIREQQGNAHTAAITYHQLGIIAQEQRDFAGAEAWYRKSLAIKEQQGNAHGAALTYRQLGRIAEEQRDFAGAEAWYRKSLAIWEQQGDERGAASTYHELGSIAHARRDFASAEAWYRKSLAIKEQQGNAHGAAGTYNQLGTLAFEQRDFATAGPWFLKAIAGFAQANDPYNMRIALRSLLGALQTADEPLRTRLKESWQAAGLDRLATLDDLERQCSEEPLTPQESLASGASSPLPFPATTVPRRWRFSRKRETNATHP